ncbi:MAG: hypothetical protein ACFFCI_00650 [Promethearchaeota archaeon]
MSKTVLIPSDLHKKLKIEAINQEKQLKDLVAEILSNYLEAKNR